MFASITKVQSHYFLNSFWTRLEWCKITQLFFPCKMTGFYMEKTANLLWVSTSFLSRISAIIRFVVNGVAKLVFVSVAVEADGSPAPTLWSSLLSAPLPRPFLLGCNLSNSCSTDSCWFPSIRLFAMFAKSTNDYFFWNILNINNFSYDRNILTSACLCCLPNWLLRRFALRETPRGKKSPRHEVSETNFRFGTNVSIVF